MAGFSGYIAVDELYEGGLCVLSLVDNRTFRRLSFEVLDHAPTHDDIRKFLRRFRAALDRRGLQLLGVTTDGSALYPVPLAEVFPGVRHQVCEFHVKKEILKAVLHAVAKLRKKLAAAIPKLPKGRPTAAGRRAARRAMRLRTRVRELFDHPGAPGFVRRHLTDAEGQTLTRLCRPRPQLRALRTIVDEVYPGAPGCRTHTALEKLRRLRRRVRRFRSLGRSLDPGAPGHSPNPGAPGR